MRYYVTLAAFFLVTLAGHGIAIGISRGQQRASALKPSTQRVVAGTTRPDLGVDYSATSQIKIASRKTDYHLREMVTIDIAVLNTSDSPIFFRELTESVTLQARDVKGEKVDIVPYLSVYTLVTPDSFTKLQPHEMTVASYNLLAGCDRRAFNFVDDLGDDERSTFGNNQFVSFGRACIDIKLPGTYTITARIGNRHVLVTSTKNKYRTAVGTLISAPFNITIAD